MSGAVSSISAGPLWEFPNEWAVLPSEVEGRHLWASGIAQSLAPDDPVALAELRGAVAFASDDPGTEPFLVLATEEPWVRGAGWLRVLPSAVGLHDKVVAIFDRETDDPNDLYSCNIYEIEIGGGSVSCLILHTFEPAEAGSSVLVERASGFFIDEGADFAIQVAVVTPDLALFDDLPGLVAEVLDRSMPGGQG